MSQLERKTASEQENFSHYCRQWLQDNKPHDLPPNMPLSALEVTEPSHMRYLQAWQKSAYDAGLVGCDYPKEFGGGGRSQCQHIANREMQAAGTPYFPNIVGLGMTAPTLIHHATDELKRKLLPGILSGEEIWCQGFSEPAAGSDLANIQTFAERRGDKWLINGHKVWTSLAHFAEWMILLARTDRSNKYEGLSYFIVPVRTAIDNGITIAPLIKMTGESGFNEIFFDNLEIDDCLRVDQPGAGWRVAMTTLAHERGAGGLVTPAAGGISSDDGPATDSAAVIALARESLLDGSTAADDAYFRDRIVQLAIRERAFGSSQLRAQISALIDHPMRLPLQNKLLGTELAQDTAALAMDISGMSSGLYQGDANAPRGGHWPRAYMNSFGMTIAAGTSEVQRNILGERVLGMPKSK